LVVGVRAAVIGHLRQRAPDERCIWQQNYNARGCAASAWILSQKRVRGKPGRQQKTRGP
jgi:hypothetical protein